MLQVLACEGDHLDEGNFWALAILGLQLPPQRRPFWPLFFIGALSRGSLPLSWEGDLIEMQFL